jgi:unsaturated rhamnogalacturonyl hydrolase
MLPCVVDHNSQSGARCRLDEAARRILAVFDSSQRDSDGLLWHGFDAATGEHSCCKWGDGNGWTFMALVDAARGYQRANYTTLAPSRYPQVVRALREFAQAWSRVQDPGGQWHQLMDDNTTYLASSATGFGLFSLVSGVQLGLLEPAMYAPVISRAWSALAQQVRENGEQTVAKLSWHPLHTQLLEWHLALRRFAQARWRG